MPAAGNCVYGRGAGSARRGRADFERREDPAEAKTEFRDATLADLALLPIQHDGETNRQAWGETLRLAVRHRLTFYDAAYLELAQRRGLPLATLDAELRAAAKAEKVHLLGT